MRNIKKTQGMKSAFSMMELIIYIVVVGIIAGFGLPMLFSIQDDAKISNEKSTVGAIRSSVGMLHGKAVIKNGNFKLKIISGEDGTTEKLAVIGVTKTNYPTSLSADESVIADTIIPATTEAMSTNYTMGLVLEYDSRSDWNTSAVYSDANFDTANGVFQMFTGPATRLAGVVDDKTIDDFEYDNAGGWVYNAISGSISYVKNLTEDNSENAIALSSVSTIPDSVLPASMTVSAASAYTDGGTCSVALAGTPSQSACTTASGTWSVDIKQN